MSCFSKVSNEFFYGLNGDQEKSILKEVNDNKVLLIIHNLYLMTDRKGRAITSIDFLIEECCYKVTKKCQTQVKDILNALKELNLISFEGEIKSYTKIIKINTENLNVENEFFVFEEEELETISNLSDDIREVNNLLKIYLYLKARCYKKKNNDGTGRSQTTYVSYKNIANHTLIGEGNIKKYIDILKESGLIAYKNLGLKYKEGYKEYKNECSNLYALMKISGSEKWLKQDLKEGLKQQRFDYESKGYIIVEKGDYLYNDRKINGRKGYLIKKENNNALTDEEKEELNKIRAREEIIKDTFSFN